MANDEVGPIEGEVVDMVTNDKALAAITAAEVDIQIATAHRYPRSLAASRKKVTDLACATEDIAASCFYSVPREGKTITGPSVRFAEIVASSWGNLRVQSRITEIGETMVVAQSACHDLEANVAMMGEARVRITKKDGKRYSEDMIGVACAAALSKATRNAIFKVVPMATFADISILVKKVAGGDSRSLEQNRKAVLDYLKSEYKVDAKRVCQTLGVSGVSEITTELVGELRGMVTAIKEADASVEDCFPMNEPPPAADGKKQSFGFAKGGKTQAPEKAPERPQDATDDSKAPEADQKPPKARTGKQAASDLFEEGQADPTDKFTDLIEAVNDGVPGSTRNICREAVRVMLRMGEAITHDSLSAKVRQAVGSE